MRISGTEGSFWAFPSGRPAQCVHVGRVHVEGVMVETDYRAIMSALVAGNRSWNQIRADLGVSKSTIDKASRVVRDHLSTQDLLECGVGSHSHECGTHLVNQARVGPC